MKWLPIALIAGILALDIQRIHGQTAPEIGMASSGFLGNGPWVNWSGRWLALMERNGAFELRDVPVSSTRQTIPAACDGNKGFVFNVTASPAPPGSLLLRGFSSIKAGPVVTAFHGNRFLFPGEFLSLSLGSENQWLLEAFGTARPAPPSDPRITNYQVQLTKGSRAATVFSLTAVDNDRPPEILWVGDLDSDGVPDIFADVTNHYNLHRFILYLSSPQRGGQLLVESASLTTGGC
jgi:hypothetical protein